MINSSQKILAKRCPSSVQGHIWRENEIIHSCSHCNPHIRHAPNWSWDTAMEIHEESSVCKRSRCSRTMSWQNMADFSVKITTTSQILWTCVLSCVSFRVEAKLSKHKDQLVNSTCIDLSFKISLYRFVRLLRWGQQFCIRVVSHRWSSREFGLTCIVHG